MRPTTRLLAAAACVCGLIGCGASSIEKQILACSEPTGALASTDAELVDTVRQVEQQRGWPSQLDGAKIVAEGNAAATLAECYSDPQHLRLGPRAMILVEPGPDLEERDAFLKRHDQLIRKTAAAVDLPRCRFAVGHRFGFFAHMGYLDDASLAARLLHLRATRDDLGDRSPETLTDLLRSLRVTHWLARVRRVEARVLACTLRREALATIRQRFFSGDYRRFEAEQVYSLLRDQLADWPEDRRMLVGERATVLHAYEAIRRGLLGRLITLEERKRLKESGLLGRMESATPQAIDADELAYLRLLEAVVKASDRSQPQRRQVMNAELDRISQRPTLFARGLFLLDLPDAMHRVASDRALVEAWTIALAMAADLKTPPFRVSPLSGEPYETNALSPGAAIVYGDGADDLVELPELAPR
ncbi:hypothetical protein MalM25_35120 [Planctomycetes bacterium MalM25]|nr:hypothetical protein MalM25_35120 [Planctomycetes bacterium MalM25]